MNLLTQLMNNPVMHIVVQSAVSRTRPQSPITHRASTKHDIAVKKSVGSGGGKEKDARHTADVQRALASRRRRQECLYLRYFRVGKVNLTCQSYPVPFALNGPAIKVNLDVTTSGFRVNVNHFRLTMEAFVQRTSLTSWRDLIWILEKHIIVSFTTSITSHTVRNIWPWNKSNHLAANSKATPSLGSSSAPSSPVRKAGTTMSDTEEDDQEVLEAQQKLGALLGSHYYPNLHATSSVSSDSSSTGTASPAKRSNGGGLMSELRKKFALLRKK